MKPKAIMFAFSLTALMLCNAASAATECTSLKKTVDITVCQSADVDIQIFEINEYAVYFAPKNQAVVFSFVSHVKAGNVYFPSVALIPDRICSVFDHDKPLNSLSASFALIPDRIGSPHGNITYLQNKKRCYKSPAIDNRWIWSYSVQYNC